MKTFLWWIAEMLDRAAKALRPEGGGGPGPRK